MSGFAGILIEPGAVPDAAVMIRMARLIERHGGDGSHTQSGDGFSLAHSLLCTLLESVGETQPHSLDGKTWIVGDVRLDARTELIEALQIKGQTARPESPDVYLVLLAWQVWGEKCVLNLLGDFAFAIWSSEDRSLFCARDHFGVKPFYYSLCESTFIFSNDLDAVRSHPAVSDELNEQAVCDYFAFGYNLDETCTSYSDILRIPPGHSLTYTPNNRPRLNNYRRIESASRIHYPTLPEYGEHFLEIFSKAVSDRLRTDQVTFELSGGLDSTSVAAMASNIKSGDGSYSGLGITTASPRNLSGNGEAGFAAMAAKHCGLEHQVIEAGRKEDYYQYCSTAQPYAWPFAATTQKFAAATRKHGKVLLGGQMGDVLMHASGSLALDQFRESSLPRFAIDRIRAVFSKRSIHALGIRTLLQSDRPLINMPPLPDWLKKDVIEESGAEERWKDLYYRHGRHPKGCQSELACERPAVRHRLPATIHGPQADRIHVFGSCICKKGQKTAQACNGRFIARGNPESAKDQPGR
jgi:asparagine synthase (glutamine-hydrolysing)